MKPERRAFVCPYEKNGIKCNRRVFLLPGDLEPPRCPEHSRMTHQPNKCATS